MGSQVQCAASKWRPNGQLWVFMAASKLLCYWRSANRCVLEADWGCERIRSDRETQSQFQFQFQSESRNLAEKVAAKQRKRGRGKAIGIAIIGRANAKIHYWTSNNNHHHQWWDIEMQLKIKRASQWISWLTKQNKKRASWERIFRLNEWEIWEANEVLVEKFGQLSASKMHVSLDEKGKRGLRWNSRAHEYQAIGARREWK